MIAISRSRRVAEPFFVCRQDENHFEKSIPRNQAGNIVVEESDLPGDTPDEATECPECGGELVVTKGAIASLVTEENRWHGIRSGEWWARKVIREKPDWMTYITARLRDDTKIKHNGELHSVGRIEVNRDGIVSFYSSEDLRKLCFKAIEEEYRRDS